jgi:hypothetical protein
MQIKQLLLSITLLFSSSAYCQNDITISDYVTDALVYRPAGLFGTVISSSVFLITLPMTGVATLFPPHDAIEDAVDDFILKPVNYTFNREFGVLDPVRKYVGK